MSKVQTQSHMQKAIVQMVDKPPPPEIDFTQHQLEDGTVINTQERVVKDVCYWRVTSPSFYLTSV